jgi:hypothetical protein
MVLEKSSLLNQHEFIINCQECLRIIRLTPDEVNNSDSLIKIFGMERFYIYQCKCGARFNVQLDFRRNPRSTCEISAFYTPLPSNHGVEKMGTHAHLLHKTSVNSVIKNISIDGISFVTNVRHYIEPGNQLLIKFIIKKGAMDHLVTRRVVVRTVSGNMIGAEFFADDKRISDIGIYLRDLKEQRNK